MIDKFLKDIDKRWKRKENAIIPLKIIGGASLILQYNYNRVTKDADIIEVNEITEDIKKRLLKRAGKESLLCRKYHLYIDIVAREIPFLPPSPLFYPLDKLNDELTNFRIEVLDVVDVIVSKMGRFAPTDIDDIKAMIDLNVIDPIKLEDRFKEAFELWKFEARAERLPKIIDNLHYVQRDLLMVEESEIELPRWI